MFKKFMHIFLARFTRAALEFDVVYSQTRKHWEREEEEMAFTDPLVHSIATGRLFQSVTRMEHCDESGDSDEFSRYSLYSSRKCRLSTEWARKCPQ